MSKESDEQYKRAFIMLQGCFEDDPTLAECFARSIMDSVKDSIDAECIQSQYIWDWASESAKSFMSDVFLVDVDL